MSSNRANCVKLREGFTKYRIDIGMRDAFNASWIDTRYGRLLVYRYGDKGDNGITSLYYCFLDDDWDRLNEKHGLLLNNRQDPRLLEKDGKFYLSVNTRQALDGKTSTKDRMELYRLEVLSDKMVVPHCFGQFEIIENWDGYKRVCEKNWVPFFNDGQMYYIYSLNPHRILKIDFKGGSVSLVHKEGFVSCAWPEKYGKTLRLNTPPVLMNDGTYLGTFHTRFMTRNPLPPSHYYTGFYRFSGKPPFEVLEVGKKPMILPTDAYQPNTRWNCMDLAIFPLGMEVDEDKELVRMIGGDSDHYVIGMDLSLKDVLGSLVSVGRV